MGGLVLVTEWKFFVVILIVGCLLSILVNYGVMVAISASILYPIMYAIQTRSVFSFFVLAIAGAAMIYKHMGNIRNIKMGEEPKVRDTFLRKLNS